MTARAPVALYVHVPFCLSACPYCDFVVFAGAAARGPRNRLADFTAALHVEIRLRADRLAARFGPPGDPKRPALSSVYLGGGTPSLLPAAAVADLLAAVRAGFGLASGAEVTLEMNPGPADRGDVAGFVAAGVTRLSIGAQSLDAGELRRLGRRHRSADVAAAVSAARAARVRSFNLDLLYDVPGQDEGSWRRSLEAAIALDPDHLSLYALTLDDPDAEGLTGPTGDHLPVRPGARRWRDRARARQDDDRAAEQYRWAAGRLARAGWRGYEISNWARAGHESRHNLAYWTRRPYEAVGPGAHAFDGERRRWNAARLDAWMAALRPADGSPPRLPPGGSERIDAGTAAVERLVLGLRTDAGVPVSRVRRPEHKGVLAWGTAEGLVREADGRLRLTTRGRLLSNELFARLV